MDYMDFVCFNCVYRDCCVGDVADCEDNPLYHSEDFDNETISFLME